MSSSFSSLNSLDEMESKYLVLDLDQTLIHALACPTPDAPTTLLGAEKLILDHVTTIEVVLRPYCLEFLRAAVKQFKKVFINTLSGSTYAGKIAQRFFVHEDGKAIFSQYHQIYSADRNLSINADGSYTKSLSAMNGLLKTDLTVYNTLIVDDRIDVWHEDDRSNVILISRFESVLAGIDQALFYMQQRFCGEWFGSVSDFIVARRKILHGIDISVYENDFQPWFQSFEEFRYVLMEQLGAKNVRLNEIHADTSLVVWHQCPPVFNFSFCTIAHERKNRLPLITHSAWLFQCIYFGIRPEECFRQVFEFHFYQPFESQLSSILLHLNNRHLHFPCFKQARILGGRVLVSLD